MVLVKPSREHLQSYAEALQRGWSPDYRPEFARESLELIARDPDRFLQRFDDPQALAGPVRLPDGSMVPRLPSTSRFMWDGEFAGWIMLRWSADTTDLPPTCLGHIGYGVVPWKQRQGYATHALAQMLPVAREIGLPKVEITTRPDNIASQRVILNNGGVFIEEFDIPASNGGGRGLRYIVDVMRSSTLRSPV